MPTSITSSGITFDDATTQTTSATKAGGIGTTQLANSSVTAGKINNAAVTAAKLDGVAKNGAGTNLAVGDPPVFGCRAWVAFDGQSANTTTVDGEARCPIFASGNVSKVVRNGGGNYTITFATAMPDANYAVIGLAGGGLTNMLALQVPNASGAPYIPLAGSVRVTCAYQNGAATTDASYGAVAIFR
jgi:hypothetical protein